MIREKGLSARKPDGFEGAILYNRAGVDSGAIGSFSAPVFLPEEEAGEIV
jgi:hypothetical protein